MEFDSKTIAGRVLQLKDSGWSPSQIALELKISPGRVKEVLRRAGSRSLDSRKLAEVHECVLEILGILRVLMVEPEKVIARMRKLEKGELARRVGDAISR
jgi:hypothetical protein